MNLNYSLRDYDSRKKCVEDVLSSSESVSPQYLEHMADYLLFTGDSGTTKKERNEDYPLVTKNRDVTVTKRQVSYEELVELSSEHGGECEFLNSAVVGDKNRIMDQKSPITEEDLEDIPWLRENAEVIESLKRQFNEAEGSRKYSLKKQIIDQYREQYVLRDLHNGGGGPKATVIDVVKNVTLPDEYIRIDEKGYPHAENSTSLMNPAFVRLVLKFYEDLKNESAINLESDINLLLMDLDKVVERALADNCLYMDVFKMKIHKMSNEDIVDFIWKKYRVKHSEQYFSNIWGCKIPVIISKQAQKDYVMRHHDEMGFTEWKICSRCGLRKLKHPMFFSPNSSSADGYYTICKQCRKKGGVDEV